MEVLRRLIKYLLAGLSIGIASRVLLKQAKVEDVLTLAVTAAALLCLLDLFVPSVSAGVRLGSGLMMGAQLVA